MLVDQRIGEHVVARLRGHRPVEQGVDRKADQSGRFVTGNILVGLRGSGHDPVEQIQKLFECPDLHLSERRKLLVLICLREHGFDLGMEYAIGRHRT